MLILQFGRDQDKWPRKNRISLEGTTFGAFTFIQRQIPEGMLNVFDTNLTIALLKRNGPGFIGKLGDKRPKAFAKRATARKPSKS